MEEETHFDDINPVRPNQLDLSHRSINHYPQKPPALPRHFLVNINHERSASQILPY
jgi:hypothetical protein